MKKSNIVIIILSALLIIMTIIAALNLIAIAQMKKITYGTSVEDVFNLLGERKKSSLSGFIKSEWTLANGDTIWIFFKTSEETGESYVTFFICKIDIIFSTAIVVTIINNKDSITMTTLYFFILILPLNQFIQ